MIRIAPVMTLRPVRVDAERDHRAADGLEQQHAEHGAQHAALAAGERDAADDHRR